MTLVTLTFLYYRTPPPPHKKQLVIECLQKLVMIQTGFSGKLVSVREEMERNKKLHVTFYVTLSIEVADDIGFFNDK